MNDGAQLGYVDDARLGAAIQVALDQSLVAATELQREVDAALVCLDTLVAKARVGVPGATAGIAIVDAFETAIGTARDEAAGLFARQREALATVNLALFGRTGSGKSSLIEALTHGDGATVSTGESDFTVNVRSVGWRGCIFADTPGTNGWGRSATREELESRARRAVETADVVLLCFDTQSQQKGEFEKIGAWVREYGKPVIAVLNVRNPMWRRASKVRLGSQRRRLSQAVREHASNIESELAKLEIFGAPIVAISSQRAVYARASEPYRGPVAEQFRKLRTESGPDALLRGSNLPVLERILVTALTRDAAELRLGMLRAQSRALLGRLDKTLLGTIAEAEAIAAALDRSIETIMNVVGYPLAGSPARECLPAAGAGEDALTWVERVRGGPYEASAQGRVWRYARQRLEAELGAHRAKSLAAAEEAVVRAFEQRREVGAEEFSAAAFRPAEIEAAGARVVCDVEEFLRRETSIAIDDARLDLEFEFGPGPTVRGQEGSARRMRGFPLREEELEARLGRRPTAQDILLCSLLDPANLLDIVRNFIVFETEDGRRIKKVARYQQVIAVNLAIRRILSAPDRALRGRVIHHTQGSGKSLTMVFLATKLRRLREAENPIIVIVTDRTELDRQITGVFQNAGFANPVQAESGQHLRDLLAVGAGQTVLTTVHKFHTAVPATAAPITEAENVFVLVDEAHRTQYGGLAARMRKGLPNACMLAFTGTPIDQQDRSTRRVFGDYIHRYQIADAVRDGATVPIYYEMRDARLRIDGPDLERRLRAEHPELTDADISRLRSQGGGLTEAIAGAPSRVEAIAADILDHYRRVIEPNGFKAQLVAVNRRVAVAYKAALDRFGAPESVVIMSGSNDDEADLRAHHTTAREREALTTRFKDKHDPLKILIVCDMLLTGFDAPIEQVMYLDAPLREHLLLQAIARTNRVEDGKSHGLVVDYWGDTDRIAEALSMFDQDDVRPALRPREEMVVLMHNRHRAAVRFFDGVDFADDEACLAVLREEDVRAAFDIAYRRFAEAVEMVLPDPRAIEAPYFPDLKRLAGLRHRARRRFRDERLNLRPYAEKVRALIDAELSAEDPVQLLAPVSILSSEFQAQVQALRNDEARAAEMEHAIRHEIHRLRAQDPAAYDSLAQRLEEIVNDRREARVGAAAAAAAAVRDLAGLADRLREQHQRDRAAGEDGLGGAFTGVIADGQPADARQAALGREIATTLEGLAVVDWHGKEDVQRQMRRAIKSALRGGPVPGDRIEPITARIMDVARARLRA